MRYRQEKSAACLCSAAVCPQRRILSSKIYHRAAAMPAATAPSTINPFDTEIDDAAPVGEALEPVALAVDEPELAELLVSTVAAPKIPP
jgi:hypothetical protein